MTLEDLKGFAAATWCIKIIFVSYLYFCKIIFVSYLYLNEQRTHPGSMKFDEGFPMED